MYKYLTYILNPLNEENEAILTLGGNNLKPLQVNLSTISKETEYIVSYNLSLLVPHFRINKLPLPENLIDIEQACKLVTGKSHKDFNGQLPWSIWKLFERAIKNKTQIEYFKKKIYDYEDLPDKKEVLSILLEFNIALKRLWQDILKDLIQRNEKKRFFDIEIEINKILLDRQYFGVKIDNKKLNDRLDKLDEIIAINSEILRSEWNIFDLQDKEEFKKCLLENGYDFIAKTIDKRSFEGIIEIAAERIELFTIYDTLKKAKRDKKMLLRFGAIGEDRIYPIFESLGTVTGRILVKDPNIQYIKKSSRDIIKPDDGYIFLYPDYSQCEPGILADYSQDNELIQLYNNGDIYYSLSEVVFGNLKFRKLSKKIFLSYSYGMKPENISALLSEISDMDFESLNIVVNTFFNRFNKVIAWRENLQKQFIKTGKIGTRLGNFRYRKNMNKKFISDIEKRWIISQRIQGSSSLILKKSILAVYKEMKDIQFLIPMHDAVLYQVPKDSFSKSKKIIKDIFEDSYRSICKSINPRVVFEDYWQEL